jgi:RNA polymerase sigma factor (sigma-70 family)
MQASDGRNPDGPPTSDDLVALIHQANSGDSEALNLLLERVRPHLAAAAKRYGSADGASDVVQEAGVAAWKNMASFQGGANNVETEHKLFAWLQQIVRRLGIDRRRAAKAQRRRPAAPILSLDQPQPSQTGLGFHPAADETSPSAAVQRNETIERIQEGMALLKGDESRTILWLVFVDGHSLRQAAEAMGLTYDQIRLRYHQALKELEQTLTGMA